MQTILSQMLVLHYNRTARTILELYGYRYTILVPPNMIWVHGGSLVIRFLMAVMSCQHEMLLLPACSHMLPHLLIFLTGGGMKAFLLQRQSPRIVDYLLV